MKDDIIKDWKSIAIAFLIAFVLVTLGIIAK
jgi:hypothetical protein